MKGVRFKNNVQLCYEKFGSELHGHVTINRISNKLIVTFLSAEPKVAKRK